MTDLQAGALARMRKVAARDVRRLALAACVASLLVVAWAVPLPREDVIDSVTFSIAFFATLLTGETVIFALSFSASSAWPSFREIDGHIGFRDWVLTGWLGAMLTATGLLAEITTAATCGALLFLLADLIEPRRRLSACVPTLPVVDGILDDLARRHMGP